jgi:hypothetical protein
MSSSAVGLRQQGWSTRALRSSDDFWYVLKILAAFVTLTLVLLTLKPDLLRPLFPATACFAGYWIYRRNESYYLSFMLWIFMLTPLLRRVVDWRTSYQSQSLILLAPLLITLLPAIHLRRRLVMVVPVIRTGALLTLSGIVFGAGVGMIKHPGVNVILAAVMWSAPIVLCVFAASIRERAMLGRVLTRTFLWGVLLMSVYGTYQYLVAPHWDAYWLVQVTLESFSPSYGHPEPMGIRVWSTMNSPGSFSLFLGAALVWLCTVDGLLAILACGMGYITLSLTLVRTAWIMTIIGILIYVLGCRTRPSLRSTTTALLTVGLVAYVLVHATQFAGVFDRLQTFSSLSADGSVHVRMEMYHHMNDYILSAPFGLGLESPAVINRYYLDSSFVEVFVMLGWLGALCYLSGFAYLLLHVVLSLRSFSRERVAAAAITLACATQIFSGNAFYQQGGTVLWLFIGVWASLSMTYAVPTGQPAYRRAIEPLPEPG